MTQPHAYGAPPMQHSMLPPQPYGMPHAPYYPPQYSQPPIAHSMIPMARPMTAPVMPSPMMAPHIATPVVMTPGVVILNNFRRGDELQPGSWIPVSEPTVLVGLGWDFTGGETFDLDASVTGFDFQFNVVDTIYFNHKNGLSGSVIHYGDNLTGQGEGDDEVIKIILQQVPRRVQYLAVTINSFKKNSLIRARSAFIRLYTRTYHIGKYLLNATGYGQNCVQNCPENTTIKEKFCVDIEIEEEEEKKEEEVEEEEREKGEEEQKKDENKEDSNKKQNINIKDTDVILSNPPTKVLKCRD